MPKREKLDTQEELLLKQLEEVRAQKQALDDENALNVGRIVLEAMDTDDSRADKFIRVVAPLLEKKLTKRQRDTLPQLKSYLARARELANRGHTVSTEEAPSTDDLATSHEATD